MIAPKNLPLVQNLAKAARTILIECSDDPWALSEAGSVLEAALRRVDRSSDGRELPERAFPTRGPLWIVGIGWHSPVDILAALARMDGDHVFGPSISPCSLRTPLLRALVVTSEEVHRPWREGSDELNQRKGMIWWLRDLGLWEMPKARVARHSICC